MSVFCLCFLSFYYRDRLYKAVLFKNEKKETGLLFNFRKANIKGYTFGLQDQIICNFFIIIFLIFMWRRVRDLKNSYLEASLSQAELMGITLFCQNPKEKLYTFPPSLFISLLCMPPSQLLTQNEIFFFSLYLKGEGKKSPSCIGSMCLQFHHIKEMIWNS